MDSLATIRCDNCEWLRRTPLFADAIAYASYRSRLGECAGHKMLVSELDAAEITTALERVLGRPPAPLDPFPALFDQAFGMRLWPLELSAARLFTQALYLGTSGAGLESMLQLVLGRHMLLDARDRLIKIAWCIGRVTAGKAPVRDWRRKFRADAVYLGARA